MIRNYVPATESLPPTVKDEMQEMYFRLGFSQMVAQRIDSSQTLASLSDEDITAICDVIRRLGGSVGIKMPDRGNQISVPVTKNSSLQHSCSS